MWDCALCGCQAIAGGLGVCPQCFKPKGDDMPKVTSGGYTNAAAGQPQDEPQAEPGTTGEPAASAPPAAPVEPSEPPAGPAAGVPPEA